MKVDSQVRIMKADLKDMIRDELYRYQTDEAVVMIPKGEADKLGADASIRIPMDEVRRLAAATVVVIPKGEVKHLARRIAKRAIIGH